MLYIILTILKVIGIILALVLLIVLGALLLVLLVPVRYKLKAEYYEDIYLKGTASWLFGLISISVFYKEGEFLNKVRIFFYSLKDKDDEKQDEIKNREKEIKQDSSKDSKKDIAKDSSVNDNSKEIKTSQPIEKKHTSEKTQDTVTNREKKAKESNKEQKPKQSKKPKNNSSQSEKDEFDEDEVSTLNKVINFFKDEDNIKVLKKLKKNFLRLIKHASPSRLDINVEFGTGDPALTGKIIGIISLIYPLFKGDIKVIPNFEEMIIRGSIFTKGRITIICAVIIVINLLMDRQIRSFVKENIY